MQGWPVRCDRVILIVKCPVLTSFLHERTRDGAVVSELNICSVFCCQGPAGPGAGRADEIVLFINLNPIRKIIQIIITNKYPISRVKKSLAFHGFGSN